MKQNIKKKNMFDDSSEEMIKQIKKLREVDCFDWANASQHQDGVAINAELILPLNLFDFIFSFGFTHRYF